MSTNPFPGLRPFEQKETHLFFGRDGQSNELLRRLQQSRFLALVGVSGSGKSSLVRAGLLPALYGGLMSSVESDWRIAVFRPGNNPIGNMAHALITQAGFGGENGMRDIEEVVAETTLRRGNLGLLELVRQAGLKQRKDGRPFLSRNENLLVVVDQFEELFRIIEQHDQLVRVKQLTDEVVENADAFNFDGNPREEAAAFVKLLLESTRKNDDGVYPENIYIIVTMRSDYLGETAQFWGMPERINEGQYLIPRMTRDERRKAIVGPVAVAEGSISEPLVNELLNDAGENPGHLPILQHSLMRMWELWERSPQRNGPLDLKHYEQIGRMSGALSQHANEALAELPPPLKTLAAKVFKCLTEKGLSNREIRRPMTIADICAVVQANEKDVKQVVETFRKEGRWFLMPSPPAALEHDTLIDISHESLISGWDELRKWVNEEAESALTYKRLADTAILKERGKEDFYRGPALQLALNWQKENAPNAAWARRYHPEYEKAMTFLGGSNRQAAKESRRRKFFKLLLIVMTGITVVSSAAALNYQRTSLSHERLRARNEYYSRLDAVEREKQAILLKVQAEEAQKNAELEKARAKLAQRKAESTTAELALSLIAQKAAVIQANNAEKAAVAERDRARRLERENLEQATIYGYFKIAFDDIAAGNRADAVKNLRMALDYFEDKGDKVNTILTLINIADVLRTTPGGKHDVAAVTEYKRALSLLGSNNDDIRLNTLKKAAAVWKDSTSQANAQQAAAFFEESATLLAERRQVDEASKEWIAAGKIYARLMDEESAKRADDLFYAAVLIHGNNQTRIADTYAAIGQTYVGYPKPGSESSRNRTSSTNEKTRAEINRYREDGADFFLKASDNYRSLADLTQAADMQRAAANLLSESDSPGTLEIAVKHFLSAAELHARSGNVSNQESLLAEAGEIFLGKENSIQRRPASVFFDALLRLAPEDGKARAEALRKVAGVYQQSSAQEYQLKGAEHYEQAAAVYHRLNMTHEEIETLIQAGGGLRKIDDGTAQAKAAELFKHALEITETDPAIQIKTLIRIGLLYDSSTRPAQKREAVKYFRNAATVARQSGNKDQELQSLLNAGTALIGVKDEASQLEANDVFREAVNLYESDVQRQTVIFSRIGSIYASVEAPNKERVYEYYAKAVELARQNNKKEAEITAILSAARTAARIEGETGEKVDQFYNQAEAVYVDDPQRRAATLVRIGRIVLARGSDAQITRAEQYFDRALAVAGQDKKLLSSIHLAIGVAFQPVERSRTVVYYQKALTIAEQAGDKYRQAMAFYRLATSGSKEAKSQSDRALGLFAEVLPTLESSGNRVELADAYYARGALYRLRKEYQESVDSYTRALEIFRTLQDQETGARNTQNALEAVQKVIEKEREKPKETDSQPDLGYFGDVDLDAPSCFNSSRTATSSCESRSVSVSPIGRVTSMSTGLGLRSMSDPSLAVIFMRGKRKLVPSINDWFHVKIIQPEVVRQRPDQDAEFDILR